MIRLFIFLVFFISFANDAKAGKYEESRAQIASEVEKISDKCWDNVSIKDAQTTADMRIVSYEVVKCLEKVLKEKSILMLKKDNTKEKVFNSIDAINKANSDFYFTIYNVSKYCCANENDDFCPCGTSAQVEYYFPWIENLKKMIVDVMMVEKIQKM